MTKNINYFREKDNGKQGEIRLSEQAEKLLDVGKKMGIKGFYLGINGRRNNFIQSVVFVSV